MISGLSFGVSIGVLGFVIIIITVMFITILVILIHSNRALRRELFKTKLIQQPAIYEELESVVRLPSPTIDTGKNTAYASASMLTMNTN